MTGKMVTIPLETLRHLYDLAMDSPLMRSGSFETDDVIVLRETAERINVDPLTATPDEFVRDFPHPFEPATLDSERRSFRGEPRDRFSLAPLIWETDAEVLARCWRGAPRLSPPAG